MAQQNSPAQVFFDNGEGPAIATEGNRTDDIPSEVFLVIGLPDPDADFEKYCKALEEGSFIPRKKINLFRHRARSYCYIPFGLPTKNSPWDGVISIDSSLPLKDRKTWEKLLPLIKNELESIGCLWKLESRL